MTKKDRAQKAVDALIQLYPEAVCSLNASNPFELLVAVRLSAQCTDARVNLVTPALFAKYKTLDDYCNAKQEEVEELIHSCGFYKSKAQSIIGMAKIVKEKFGGVVPDNIEELVTLPGVGRKTANLIVGDVYGKAAIVVDTHMIRISNRIGLVSVKDPKKIEFELKKIIPPDESSDFCHRIVMFGRDVCTARNPKCGECIMADFCKKAGVKQK